ncbi:MAG: efflux transporter outer membrane subunit [Gammaproteobacteria bacterium]|nr:efflux transporter outer membrane subunit [Gammaproteobacteria bacterium]
MLSACAMVNEPPRTPTLAGSGDAFSRTPGTVANPVPDDWWRLYDDAQLDRLVNDSLRANADLRVAYANLDAAHATRRQARQSRWPQTTLESGLTIDDTRNQPSAASVPSTDWDFGVTASWEIDVFGRLRAQVFAAEADLQGRQAALDGIKVAVVADTVQSYVEFCGFTRALRVANEIATRQQRYVQLVQRQLDAGEVSPLEVAQAASLAASLRAATAPFEAWRASALYRLATLQGQPPSRAEGLGVECAEMPQLRAGIPVADGLALLSRRPDIREAEQRLAAAAANIAVARADLYPRLNLGGVLGVLSGNFASVATPLLTWSLPNQAPARAKLAQAGAAQRAALATWDVVVLNALREVETALAAYSAELARNQALLDATAQAQDYARRAAVRVRTGDASALLQVDAERTLATAMLAQVQSELVVAQAEVALFRALGSGWRTENPPR